MRLTESFALLVGAAFLFPIASPAQDPEAPESQPEAVALLAKASDYYKTHPIELTAKSVITQSLGEMKNEIDVMHRVIAADGNVLIAGSGAAQAMPTATIHFADGSATAVLGKDGVIQRDGFASFRALFEDEDFGYDKSTGENSIVAGGPATGLFQRLLFAMSEPALSEFVGLKLGDEVEVDGKKAQMVTGEIKLNPLGLPVEGLVPFEMTIQTGEVPALLTYQPDLSPLVAKMAESRPQLAALKFDIDCTYTGWKVGSDVALADLKKPDIKDLKAYDSFGDFVKASQGGGGPDPQTLIGKAAPDFELDLLEGGKFKLSNEKGKSVVILDFWATWCGPCVRAMPIIDKVATAHAAKGVKLIAVNLRETEDQVKAFMAQHKLSPTVVFDREGATANDYLVRGIPQTVIIDKEGNVANVHVGLLPNLEEQLNSELKELVGSGE